MLNIISNASYINVADPGQMYYIWKQADKFMCEQASGLNYSSYMLNSSIYNAVMYLNDYTQFQSAFGWSLQMSQLTSGPLLSQILANMQAKVSSPTSTQQIYVYTIVRVPLSLYCFYFFLIKKKIYFFFK
jgi:hypothetical protein